MLVDESLLNIGFHIERWQEIEDMEDEMKRLRALRIAFFCSSIFIRSRSVIFRLIVLIASLWSGERLIHAVVSHGYGIVSDVAPEHEMEKILFK